MRSEMPSDPVSLIRPRFSDGVLLILLTVLTVFSPKIIPAGILGDTLAIKTADSVYEISLENEGTHVIQGRLGPALLVIRDGEARLRSAPCPLKICEAMGPVSRSGDVILCLPNRVYIRVAGGEEMDAVSR